MSREMKFAIYCIEEYKKAKSLTGRGLMALFHEYSVLDYLVACYGALHTTGGRYIVEDIDLFIAARQSD
ncbi:MAG: DUF3791 domain-containing protein [Thermoguttaceae bacterium]